MLLSTTNKSYRSFFLVRGNPFLLARSSNIKFPVAPELIIAITFYSPLLVSIIILILNTGTQLAKLICYFSLQAVKLYSPGIPFTRRFYRFPKFFLACYNYTDRVSNKGFRNVGFISSSTRAYRGLRSLYIYKYYYNRSSQPQKLVVLVSKDTIRLRLSLKRRPNNRCRSKLSSLGIYISISYTPRTFRSNRIYS